MSNITFWLVSGYFSSGSSAVVDLLKEIDNAHECNAEIRIIKDPYGICQMEDALVNKWELINSSAAIYDFLNLSKICNRKGGYFPLAPAGLCYKYRLNKNFMKITKDYINKLTLFTYKSDYYYSKFKKKYFRYVIDRCLQGIEKYSKKKINTTKYRSFMLSCYSHPTQEEFNKATQEYFENLYENYGDSKKPSYVILDQAVSPNNTEIIHRYFKKAKMIIVDRDVRDMYIDDINWGEILDDDCSTIEAGKRYVIRQKHLRKNKVVDKDVMYVRFEDLILDYDTTVSKILCFLGIDDIYHNNKFKYLKPEISTHNIGIWKKQYENYKEALDTIGKDLPELCYKK